MSARWSRFILFAALGWLVGAGACAVESPDLDEWKEDLAFLQHELPARHIDLYHTLSADDFAQALQGLERALPQLTEAQIIVELMALAHRIGDGHTAVPLWHRDYHQFPIELAAVDDILLVVGATDAHRDLLGARLAAVNGHALADIAGRLATVVPFGENQYSIRARTAGYLPTAELLLGLEVIDEVAPTVFDFERDGQHLFRTLAPDRRRRIEHRLSFRGAERFDAVAESGEGLWFAPLGSHDTIYVRFNRYPSAGAMDSFGQRLLRHIDEHQSRQLVVDLRGNYGGDFFVGLMLANHLVLADSIDWKSGVFALIDHRTFSAAMNNASQYRQILNATLVGQPTGGRPSGYQDMGQLRLPNSRLLVTYSKRHYRFEAGTPDALYPDIEVAVQADDYRNGRDRALERVLAEIDSRSGRRQALP